MPANIESERRILIHFGELSLKGFNRPDFIRKLRKNLNRRMAAEDLPIKVQDARDRLFIQLPKKEVDVEKALTAVQEVPGISWLTDTTFIPAAQINLKEEPNLDAIRDELLRHAQEAYVEDGSFLVRVRRSLKSFPHNSVEYERLLGGEVLQNTGWSKVKMKGADVTLHVDILPSGVYFYHKRLQGTGGLPVSSSGRVLVLLSGGFDSPVAAWQMARRGCNVDFVHFTANLMQQKNAEDYKISRIAKHLSRTTGRSRLFLLPYTHFDLALMAQDVDYDLILFRRFMARMAEGIADKIYAQGLVTGDNLGQVASQTMENMVSVSHAVDLPVFRPLLAYEKEDIVSLSRKLGLFEVSKEPYKDCCALISRSPKTVSRHDKLTNLEERCFPDYKDLMQKTYAEALQLDFEYGQAVDARPIPGIADRLDEL